MCTYSSSFLIKHKDFVSDQLVAVGIIVFVITYVKLINCVF